MEENTFTICFLGVTFPQWLMELYKESLDKGYPLEVYQIKRFIRVLENKGTDFFNYLLEADLVNCSKVFLEAIDDEVIVCSINNILPFLMVFNKYIPVGGGSGLAGVKNEIVLKTPRFLRELLLTLYMLPDDYRIHISNIITNSILYNEPQRISRSFIYTNILYLRTRTKIMDLKDIVWNTGLLSSIEVVVPKKEIYFYRIMRVLESKEWSIEHSSTASKSIDYYTIKISITQTNPHIILNTILLGSLLAAVRTYFDMFVDVFRRTRSIYTTAMASLYEKPFMNIFVTSRVLKKLVKIYPSYIDAISYIDRFIHEMRSIETHLPIAIEEKKSKNIIEAESRMLTYVNDKIVDYMKGVREAVSDTAETLITQIHSLGTLIQLQRTVSALIVTSLGILINLLRILLIEILKIF